MLSVFGLLRPSLIEAFNNNLLLVKINFTVNTSMSDSKLQALKDMEESIARVERWGQVSPRVFWALGNEYWSMRGFDSALSWWRRSPEWIADMLVGKGNAYARFGPHGNHEKAKEWTVLALQVDQNNLNATRLLAELYFRERRWDEARDLLTTVVRRNPEDWEARARLAWSTFMVDGDLLKAQEELESLANKQSDDWEVFRFLGELYRRQGAYEKAEAMLRRGIELSPEQVDLHLSLALVYVDQERYDDAMDEASLAVRLAPSHYMAHALLAGVYQKLGRYEDSISEYRFAVKGRPEWYLVYLGDALVAAGRLDEARSVYMEALKYEKSRPKALQRLGSLEDDLVEH
jgi:tetratricopeptide (TPR) repeat protein